MSILCVCCVYVVCVIEVVEASLLRLPLTIIYFVAHAYVVCVLCVCCCVYAVSMLCVCCVYAVYVLCICCVCVALWAGPLSCFVFDQFSLLQIDMCRTDKYPLTIFVPRYCLGVCTHASV